MAKVSAADRLAKIPVARRCGYKSWFELADKGLMEELEEIRRRWHANQYQHNKTVVFNFCAEEFKLPVKRQAFLRWLEEKPHDG